MRAWIRRHRVATAAGAVAALVLVGVIGFALASGFDETTTVRVSGDGVRVVRVALVDRRSASTSPPTSSRRRRAPHVVVEVANEADGRHDLAVAGGPRTAVLAPGENSRLDLGRVTTDRSARCTIGDHDIAGMALTIRAV
jgi:hypothetical protein